MMLKCIMHRLFLFYDLIMINTDLVQRLQNLGYSKDDANQIFAKHLSCGTLDELEVHILRITSETLSK